MSVAPFDLGDVQVMLALKAYRRETLLEGLGHKQGEDLEVKQLIVAANIVEVCRKDPKIWNEVRTRIRRGLALTQDTGE
jgi:hypothetical protein